MIELEVGQVWGKDGRSTFEILKIYNCDDGFEWVCYFYQETGSTSCNSRQVSNFTINKTLITNADGTPYVAPNDYRSFDIWISEEGDCVSFMSINTKLMFRECLDYGNEYEVLTSSCDLIENPEDYRLIYRDGKVVNNG